MTLNACHSRNHSQNVRIHVFNRSLHEPNHEMMWNTKLNEFCHGKSENRTMKRRKIDVAKGTIWSSQNRSKFLRIVFIWMFGCCCVMNMLSVWNVVWRRPNETIECNHWKCDCSDEFYTHTHRKCVFRCRAHIQICKSFLMKYLAWEFLVTYSLQSNWFTIIFIILPYMLANFRDATYYEQ